MYVHHVHFLIFEREVTEEVENECNVKEIRKQKLLMEEKNVNAFFHDFNKFVAEVMWLVEPSMIILIMITGMKYYIGLR